MALKNNLKNGLRYDSETKSRARALRRSGHTHREISAELGISAGTALLWVRGIKINRRQKKEILERWHKKYLEYVAKNKDAMGARARKNLPLYQYKRIYSKDSLIESIVSFVKEHGRIPLKREFGDRKVFRDLFGSWNKAVEASGLVPNEVLFSKKHVANDGHVCDSFTEKIIDDWLFQQKIDHTRNFKYPGTKMTADFLIGKKNVLEFFGLAGVQKEYDKNILRKRTLCNKHGLRLIEIYPRDIYAKGGLKRALSGIV